jgi:hypothetical protein
MNKKTKLLVQNEVQSANYHLSFAIPEINNNFLSHLANAKLIIIQLQLLKII